MRRELGHGFVLAEIFQQRDMFIEIDKVEEAVVDLPGMIPDIHGGDQPDLEYQEEKPFDDLDGIGNEEGRFHRHKDGDDGAHQPEG
jgi:hypothetical protein